MMRAPIEGTYGLTRERYNPVPFDTEASHARWMKRPGFAGAYAALADEYAALDELLRARNAAGMTQAGNELPSATDTRTHTSKQVKNGGP